MEYLVAFLYILGMYMFRVLDETNEVLPDNYPKWLVYAIYLFWFGPVTTVFLLQLWEKARWYGWDKWRYPSN